MSLLVLSGHPTFADECPLSGVKLDVADVTRCLLLTQSGHLPFLGSPGLARCSFPKRDREPPCV